MFSTRRMACQHRRCGIFVERGATISKRFPGCAGFSPLQHANGNDARFIASVLCERTVKRRERRASADDFRGSGRDKGLNLAPPPNRTGGFPASGSPVSGFVVLRLSASTRVPLPRTTAHVGQTIHSASAAVRPPAPAACGRAAFPTDSAIAVAHSHPLPHPPPSRAPP